MSDFLTSTLDQIVSLSYLMVMDRAAAHRAGSPPLFKSSAPLPQVYRGDCRPVPSRRPRRTLAGRQDTPATVSPWCGTRDGQCPVSVGSKRCRGVGEMKPNN